MALIKSKVLQDKDEEDKHSSFGNTLNEQEELNLLEEILDPNQSTANIIDIFYKNYFEQGIHDFIVNFLHGKSDEDVEFFICDFVFWEIIRGSSSIQRLLINRAQSNMKMFLMINWQLQAFSEVLQINPKFEHRQEIIENLQNKIVASIVNQASNERNSQHNQRTSNDGKISSLSGTGLNEMDDIARQKELRIKYIDKLNLFITNLVDVSLSLKAMDKPERKAMLTDYIERSNKYLNYLRHYYSGMCDLYNGITIPFVRAYGENFDSNLIVNVVPNQFICFETRKRVPYRIVVETIDPTDLRKYKPKKIRKKDSVYNQRLTHEEAKLYEYPQKPEKQDQVVLLPEDIKQNKYRDLTFLQDQINKEINENEKNPKKNDSQQLKRNETEIKLYGMQKVKYQKSISIRTSQLSQQDQIQHSNNQFFNTSGRNQREQGETRKSQIKRVKNYLQQNTEKNEVYQLENQQINDFHRNLHRKQTMQPDSESYKAYKKLQNQLNKEQNIRKSRGSRRTSNKLSTPPSGSPRNSNKYMISDINLLSVPQKQSKQIFSFEEEESKQKQQFKERTSIFLSYETPSLNPAKKSNNGFDLRKSIIMQEKEYQKRSFISGDKKKNQMEKNYSNKKQGQILKCTLNPEKQKLYDRNIKRFNILFKPQSQCDNQIVRRFSFSDTNSRICSKRLQENQKSLKDFLAQKEQEDEANGIIVKEQKIRRLKDLKIADVLQFFKDLMSQYPDKYLFLETIYKYLNYDLIESRLKELGQENDNDIEFPRKFGPWGELWEDRKQLIKRDSLYGHFPSFKIRSIIIKGGDDLRQELVCMQLIYKMDEIFKKAGLDLWLKPYEIIVTSSSSGIIEFLPNTQSIDGLKKQMGGKSLDEIYMLCFGQQLFEQKVQMNFIRSLAAYSIVGYLLQVKDRHNGNILIDSDGHLIHIDFGFIFSISPGNLNFESAPFKFTKEYGKIMGGVKSEKFAKFKQLVYEGMNELRKKDNLNLLCNIIEIMSEESDLPCYENFYIYEFRKRFKEDLSDAKFKQYVEGIISQSYDSMRTVTYDWFQKKTNGIMS
ncbi:Protein kinase-like domain [Pseudocohnilembus persalinus]|uniref:1-phosphatidylinositol 4-kinase n=1 Tax=Pseudocohnilembus persalinus TaxID=266149 RepID=A0A0V0QTN7_PSEPJ|nr:Protein kinase-like domain [Pseudocohnilembus persalinus]|eukprot:KRX05376.1 Protein kinase-like domain [Pseudocohnilembus persalinus]